MDEERRGGCVEGTVSDSSRGEIEVEMDQQRDRD